MLDFFATFFIAQALVDSNFKPIEVKPAAIVSKTNNTALARGLASWYGPGYHGNQTASGEIFNQYSMTAAHPTLPFDTKVKVTNLDTNKTVTVVINDRGPFVGGRIIDLSFAAAQEIGGLNSGVFPVKLEIVN